MRLKQDLEGRANMETSAAKPTRENLHTVTPYIVVHQALELVEFVKQAFGATEWLRTIGSGGGWHVEVQLGNSTLMIGGGGEFRGPAMPTALWYFVEDVDAVHRRALELGATSISEPVDQPYGVRECGVKEHPGNNWYISTNKGASYIPEGFRTITCYLHPPSGARMIDFITRAFAAEVLERHASPEGAVVHARVRVGDSVIAMGEARGPYQPMPTMFYLFVDDADAWYQRALAGGATSMFPPAPQPYGHRVGAVSDSFGNQWYIAMEVRDSPQ
jgi:PhnB protein